MRKIIILTFSLVFSSVAYASLSALEVVTELRGGTLRTLAEKFTNSCYDHRGMFIFLQSQVASASRSSFWRIQETPLGGRFTCYPPHFFRG